MMFPLKNCKIGPVFMPVFMPIKQENLRSLLENSLKSLKNSGFLVLEIQALKTVSEKRESWNHYNWGIAAVDSIKQWCRIIGSVSKIRWGFLSLSYQGFYKLLETRDFKKSLRKFFVISKKLCVIILLEEKL